MQVENIKYYKGDIVEVLNLGGYDNIGYRVGQRYICNTNSYAEDRQVNILTKKLYQHDFSPEFIQTPQIKLYSRSFKNKIKDLFNV